MTKSIYDIEIEALSNIKSPGEQFALGAFKGKKILIVNTASECGFTAQYAQLQELHELHNDKVTILGCPSNDFGNQEPGDGQSISKFCSTSFGVTFPLTQKVKVTGQDKHPLYQWLTKQSKTKEEVKWNFQKFLIDEQGQLSHVFAPSEEPLSEAVLSALNL
ncbi:MAG: glutathione peroxidase [Limisphaerales bacterium]